MSNDIKPVNTLIKSVNLYTNRMRKSRKETIKNVDLRTFRHNKKIITQLS